MIRQITLLTGTLLCAFIFGCGRQGESEIEAGVRALEQGRNEKCIRYMQKALLLSHDDEIKARAHNCVGLAYWRMGNEELAALAFETGADLDPVSSDSVFNLGVLMAETGRPSNAVALLRKAALIDSTGTTALKYLAHLHQLWQDWGPAGVALEEAARRAPSSPAIISSLAVLELQTGSVDRAISGFQRALENDAAYAPAVYNLAVVNEHWLGNKTQAKAYYEDYLRNAPDGARAGLAHDAIDAMKEIEPEPVEQAAAPPPPTPPPRPEPDERPPAPPAREKPRPARIVLAKTTPGYDEYMRMGGVLAAQDRAEGAVHNYLLAVALAGQAGDKDRAERAEKAALDAAGRSARARYALGSYLFELARKDEAMEQFRKSAEMDSHWAPPHISLGELLVEKGELDAAVVCLKQADRADPSDPMALWMLAVLYDQRMGLKTRAIQCYSWFTRRFPDDPRSKDARERLSALGGNVEQ